MLMISGCPSWEGLVPNFVRPSHVAQDAMPAQVTNEHKQQKTGWQLIGCGTFPWRKIAAAEATSGVQQLWCKNSLSSSQSAETTPSLTLLV